MFHERGLLIEIYTALKAAAGYIGVPLLDSELKAISRRLLPYHGPILFSAILEIGNARGYFPSGWALENEVRAKLGKEPRKGLTESIIEKNAEQLVKEGVAPEVARKGAAYMKRAIGIQKPPPAAPTSEQIAQALMAGGCAVHLEWDEGADELNSTLIPLSDMVIDPLAALEDFDSEPAKDPLDEDLDF